jgi:hypothetical protein
MDYRKLFWLLVVVAIIGMLVVAIRHKTSHPQPVYERYLGCGETTAGEAPRVA